MFNEEQIELMHGEMQYQSEELSWLLQHKAQIRNWLSGGAEKHRSKGDLAKIRYLNSQQFWGPRLGGGENGVFPIGHSEKNTDYQKNVTFILRPMLVSPSKNSFS